MEKITRHILIHGRVQGVFFRESMRQRALELGVAGWVRNRADGAVEALLHGAPERVEELLAWARRGPPAARVDRLHIEVAEAADDFEGFERLPSD